jgi:RNA polymerase sigma-70 factor (ECF subfamily)
MPPHAPDRKVASSSAGPFRSPLIDARDSADPPAQEDAMDRTTYLAWLRSARRRTLRADEAEDLLQTALLSALEAGRLDMSRSENRRWLHGTLRNRALHEARAAGRRRRREGRYVTGVAETPPTNVERPADVVAALPPALRTTALLVMTGHTRAEIAWLLGLSDAALRKRISDLARRWRRSGLRDAPDNLILNGPLAFGLIRRDLLGVARSRETVLATHDPDGHLFALSSQIGPARQQRASSI